MLLVAKEGVEPGHELRVDYEMGETSYWAARGIAPVEEASWRQRRVVLPAAARSH